MSVLHFDNFNHYSFAQITSSGQFTSYSTTGGGIDIQAGVGRGGLYGLVITMGLSDFYCATYRSFSPSGSTCISGVRVKYSASIPAYRASLFAVAESGQPQINFYLKPDGTIGICQYKNFLTTELATSSSAISVGSTHYFEFKVNVQNSAAGTVELLMDGTSILTYTGDTSYTGTNTWNGIYLGNFGTNGNPFTRGDATFIYNDWYVLDTSVDPGPNPNNDYLGDCYVHTVMPTADGNYTQFTPSTGTTHYALVDEKPPTDDTDYNAAATIALRDSYQYVLPTVTTGGIIATALCPYARKTDAGIRKIVDFVRAGGVDYDGTVEKSITTSYMFHPEIRTFDPSTSAEWVSASTVERGVKVSA